jgi:polyferredoxin
MNKAPSIIRSRKISQIISLVVINSYFFQNQLKFIPCPGLNCASCPLAIFACPIGSLQHFMVIQAFPFYIIGVIILLGLLFGRAICGWVCPFGFIQEILYKIPVPKKKVAANSLTPYIVLLFLVIITPLIAREPWFCKLCPVGTLQAGISLILTQPQLRSLIGPLYWTKIFILMIVLILSTLSFRPFCKLACPLGAIYGLFNRISIIRVDALKACSSCQKCPDLCQMGLNPMRDSNGRACIKCFECSQCKNFPSQAFRGPKAS